MKRIVFAVLASLYSILVLAQSSEKVEIGVKDGKLQIEKTEAWYASPWVWVVGAAVFILLLVALTRGGGRKE